MKPSGKKRFGALRTLRGYFVAGLAVLAPLFITAWVLVTIFNYLDANIREFFQARYELKVPPYGAGVLVTIIILVFVGMAARNFIGGKVLRIFESLLLRVPVASKLYGASKQIVHAFVGKDKTVFRKVVLIQYPRDNSYCMGFLTYPDQVRVTDEPGIPKLSCVFIPTTPNPTSGFLLLLPEEEITELDMSVEDALKMTISGGVVLPRIVENLTYQDGKPPELENGPQETELPDVSRTEIT